MRRYSNAGLLPLALAVIALACMPLVVHNDYIGGIFDTAATFAIVAVGLNLLSGGTGQFSLGHAGFFAIGAFTAGILNTTYGWPFWLDIPAAGVVATITGIALGIPALRLSGPYLSIATLGFGILAGRVLDAIPIARGRSGIQLNAAELGLYRFTATSFFWVILAVLVVAVFTVNNLRHGAAGRAFVALRESEPAAQANGVNLARYRVTAFAISALFAGLAGGLFAHWNGSIFSTTFSLDLSILFVAIIIVGGLDSTAGSIVGAVFLTALREALQNVGQPQLVSPLYGVAIVVALLFLPGGLIGLYDLAHGALRPRAGLSS